MSVVVVTTISCNAVILRCSSCQTEVAGMVFAPLHAACRTCGEALLPDRPCAAGFSLQRNNILIRCIAENRDGWSCESNGGRDFCPEHRHLADPGRVARPTSQTIGDA